MNEIKIAGLLDELQKIAFDTATAMEAIGVPAAMYMGYRTGGLRGAGITGLGAAGGLGTGMAAGHYVKKLTAASPWMQRHPIIRAVAESAPVGLGGVFGGAIGEHYAGSHKPAAVKTAGLLERYLIRKANPVIMFDTLNDISKAPERIRRYQEDFQHNVVPPDRIGGYGGSASSEMAAPLTGIEQTVQNVENRFGALRRAL